ncbi:hypothetical protein AAFX91_28990 [Bradyrhizobium sp. 31Argb]|uniref:hypothetical protein n=1 Tax=unclassified Bradyrhizobium TaxID=2631580 RepID=UPI00249ECD29|nr:hypothetical protein [Bradyrhizobium sp. Arg237L]MDI4238451.1 hypothetical protein [Bradyrhizobium sp. Arg237L]
MQIEAVSIGNPRAGMRVACAAVGLLTLLTLWSGRATAEDLKKLSGAQIRARFSDRQLTDEVHWREVYQRDGTFRSYSMSKVLTGKWFVRSDDLCLDLPEPDGGCFEVTSSGSWIVMTPRGLGLPSVGVLEPISDRE